MCRWRIRRLVFGRRSESVTCQRFCQPMLVTCRERLVWTNSCETHPLQSWSIQTTDQIVRESLQHNDRQRNATYLSPDTMLKKVGQPADAQAIVNSSFAGKVPFPDGQSSEIRILFMTDSYGSGKGFHLEYRQLPCKMMMPGNADGQAGAVASSNQKAQWAKFQEKTEVVTASIFVENRSKVSNPERFIHTGSSTTQRNNTTRTWGGWALSRFTTVNCFVPRRMLVETPAFPFGSLVTLHSRGLNKVWRAFSRAHSSSWQVHCSTRVLNFRVG